jgi:hypothetical protein
MLTLEHCWRILSGDGLTTLFIALISIQATATCLTVLYEELVLIPALQQSNIGIPKHIPQFKCLNSSSDYTEKWLNRVHIFPYNTFFLITCLLNGAPEVTL